MESIIEPTFDFDFSKLYLGSPISTSGGSYFTKMLYDNKSLYVQTPKSLTKQGFIKSGKKIYTDLMLSNFDNLFVDWLERLQNKCEELLYDRSQSWFETKLEKDDIESAFTSPIKIFKSGKNYLIRVNVKNGIKIYDESDNLVEMENITNNQNIISILEIQGIKFTSKNFQIEIELKQCMLVSSDPFLEKCFIKNPNKNINKNPDISNNDIINNDLKEDIESEPIELNLDEIISASLNDLNKVEEKNKKINVREPSIKEPSIKEPNIKETKIKESSRESNIKETNIKENKSDIKNVNQIVSTVENTRSLGNDMTEIDISFDNIFDGNDEAIKLKNRTQVYQEIYQKAKDKVKELKNATIVAYMELKNIKSMYMLDDVYDCDSDIEELNTIDLDIDDKL